MSICEGEERQNDGGKFWRVSQAFERWSRKDFDLAPTSMLLSVLVLLVASFVMLRVGDAINGQGLAVTRYMAREQAPLAAHFYPNDSRPRITVILYDDEFLEHEGEAWPLSYGTHAQWLERLLEIPASKPAAIFMDINFAQKREDPSIAILADTLCRVRDELGLPVFLAALPNASDGRLAIRDELMPARQSDGGPCTILGGVNDAADPIDGVAWSYPLKWHIADGDTRPGPAQDGEYEFHSAALLIATETAKANGRSFRVDNEAPSLALMWGPSIPLLHPPDYWAHCTPAESFWNLLVPYPIRHALGRTSALMTCPTHPTLSVAQLNQLEDEQLASYLDGAFVFIGARVASYDDFAISPVHGRIPGIYVHAMALDNLLVYGQDYKQQVEWELPPSRDLLLAGTTAILAVFTAHTLIWHLRTALQPRLPRAFRSPRNIGMRFVVAIVGLLLWLLRLWLQFVIALLMLVTMQAWFRIGMLPLVELIGMTLLAEGLGILTSIRRFFAVEPPPEGAPPANSGVAPSGASLAPLQEKV